MNVAPLGLCPWDDLPVTKVLPRWGNSDAQHELAIGHLGAFDFHSVVVFTILIAVRPG